jgi:hypothetical protein
MAEHRRLRLMMKCAQPNTGSAQKGTAKLWRVSCPFVQEQLEIDEKACTKEKIEGLSD